LLLLQIIPLIPRARKVLSPGCVEELMEKIKREGGREGVVLREEEDDDDDDDDGHS